MLTVSTRCKLGGVTTPTDADPTRLSRGRRAARLSGDDRKLAILATAERLLDAHALADISVDDLAKGAGISRPTFYFYFRSKEAVLLTLLEGVITEADTALEAFVANVPTSEPVGLVNIWRTGITLFFETFGAHKGVVRACQAVMATNAEVQKLWSSFMQRWISHTAAGITVERARGAAPDGVSVEELSIALNLLNERALSASFTDDQLAIPEARVLDVLVHTWVNSIYGDRT